MFEPKICLGTNIFGPYILSNQKLSDAYFLTKKSILESFLTNFNWILNMYGTTFLTNFNWMLNLYWTNKSKDTSPKIDLDSNVFSLNFQLSEILTGQEFCTQNYDLTEFCPQKFDRNLALKYLYRRSYPN